MFNNVFIKSQNQKCTLESNHSKMYIQVDFKSELDTGVSKSLLKNIHSGISDTLHSGL